MVKEFARDLRIIREQKKISLRSIAQQTRLNITVLENLENGDFTFQPQPYIRAFLKQYLSAIDVDVEEYLFDYDLARSGKYKSKFTAGNTDIPKAGTSEIQTEEITPEEAEKEQPESVLTGIREDVISPPAGNRMRITTDTSSKKALPEAKEEAKGGFNIFASPVWRNILLGLVAVLILIGLYSLVKLLFFDTKKDNPEVIRQNFEDVVKEQEKAILGRKTAEEIQDSMRKEEEKLKAVSDSITLKISAREKALVFVVTDSTDYSKPKRYDLDKGVELNLKAKSSFHISSENTDLLIATINGKPVKFSGKSVSKARLSAGSVAK